MTAKLYDILFPAGGISDASARTAKAPSTTEEGVNVRNIDPATGRDGGAVRAGLSKFTANSVFGGASGGTPDVKALTRLVYDSRKTTYTPVTDVNDVEIVWASGAPSDKEVQRLIVDPYGNVFGLCMYSTLAKWNASGRLLTSIDLPVDHKDQRCRALAIDNAGGIYAATTIGPQTSKRMLWRLMLDEFGDFYVDWTIEFEGYIPDIAFRNGFLYILENVSTKAGVGGFPSQRLGTSYIHVYDSLDTGSPRLLWYRALPYDVLQLAVDSKGAMFVTCRENQFRDDEAQDSSSSTATVDWTPENLTNYDDRIWSWHDANSIDYLAKNDLVRIWTDRSGNGRNLFHWTGDELFQGVAAPTFQPVAIAGQAAVRFTGETALGTADTFQVNAEADLDSNQSLIPSTDGHSWTMFMVIAPKRGGRGRGCIWEQYGDVGWRLVTNEDDQADGTVVPGAIRLSCTAATGSVNGPSTDQIDASVYTNTASGLRHDVAVIAIRMGDDDEGPSGGGSGGLKGSHFRVNGALVDSWTTTEDKIRWPSFLGYPFVESGINGDNKPDGFEGDIAEIITIRDTVADPDITGDEIEAIEGYLAHKWGCQHALDAAHPFKTNPPAGPSGGPSPDVPESPISIALRSTHALLIKLSPSSGDVLWTFAGSAAGKNVAVDDDGGVYIQGFVDVAPSGGSSGDPGPDGGGYDISVRKINDLGDDYSLDWSIDTTEIPETDYYGKIKIDAEGNCYVPGHTVTSDAARHTFFKIDPTGTVEWAWDAPTDSAAGRDYDCYDFAIDPKTPDFNDDDIQEPEFLYVCTYFHDNGDTLYKLRLVTADQVSGSPREISYAAVSDGDIRVIDPSDGSVSTPTGGSGALASDSEWITGTVLFGEAFYSDGEKLVVYDPKLGTVVDYVPNSAGEMPRRPKLLSRWRGALWTARFEGEPHNWFLSARGDPYDVDTNPPVTVATQAVLGSDSRAGLCPDIINSLVPYDDDLAIFGCDSTIQRLTGDPMAGGVFDLVTDEVGMAFGAPWCKDPEGFLYFFGSRGGVYRMSPEGKPVLISDRRIDRRLSAVDLATYEPRMVWNNDTDSLDLFFVPRGAASGRVTHFCWERGSLLTPFNAWWETEFDSDDLQPTSVLVGDGDAQDDRVVMIGCADGYVRKWDKDAQDDDGTQIYARVVFGPVMESLDMRLGWSWLRVALAGDEQGGPVRCELMVADEPGSIPLVPVIALDLKPGLNPPILQRCRGQSFWLRLASRSSTRRWRYERGSIQAWPAGSVR